MYLSEEGGDSLLIKNRYLVIYAHGIELGNIGVFEAENRHEAVKLATERFNTLSKNMYTYKIDGLYDGWTHFV